MIAYTVANLILVVRLSVHGAYIVAHRAGRFNAPSKWPHLPYHYGWSAHYCIFCGSLGGALVGEEEVGCSGCGGRVTFFWFFLNFFLWLLFSLCLAGVPVFSSSLLFEL